MSETSTDGKTVDPYVGEIRNGIWFEADRGLYHVVVNGNQAGLWTKWRWARRDLRYHLAREAAEGNA